MSMLHHLDCHCCEKLMSYSENLSIPFVLSVALSLSGRSIRMPCTEGHVTCTKAHRNLILK